MQAKKILVPTDFSPCSGEALDTAAVLAQGFGGELLIAFVEELNYSEGTDYLYRVPEPNTDEVWRQLRDVKPKVNVPFSHHVLKGTIVEALLEFADAQHVDLIVTGTHGRRGVTHFLMGSVAEAIVRQAKCPVLTVKAAGASS